MANRYQFGHKIAARFYNGGCAAGFAWGHHGNLIQCSQLKAGFD